MQGIRKSKWEWIKAKLWDIQYYLSSDLHPGYAILSVFWSPSFRKSINNFLTSVILENATYGYPWVKAEVRRSIPIALIDWPCALLTGMEKPSRIGNYFLQSMKGKSPSDVVNFIRSMICNWPFLSLSRIFASKECLPTRVTVNRIPLQSPCCE